MPVKEKSEYDMNVQYHISIQFTSPSPPNIALACLLARPTLFACFFACSLSLFRSPSLPAFPCDLRLPCCCTIHYYLGTSVCLSVCLTLSLMNNSNARSRCREESAKFAIKCVASRGEGSSSDLLSNQNTTNNESKLWRQKKNQFS